MNPLTRISPLLALLLLIGCAHNPPAPQTKAPDQTAAASLAPAGAGFSVSMPGTPKESTAPNGNHVFASEVNGLAYIVSYADMPPRIVATPGNMQALLDATRNSIVLNGHAKVLQELHTTLDGQPASELHLKTKEGYFMRLKLAFLGGRLYQIGVVTSGENASSPAIAQFIDSFHFTVQK